MRNFLPIPFAPYKGQYSSKPFNDRRGQQKGLTVSLFVNWAQYTINGQALGTANPNFSVAFELNVAAANAVSVGWTIHSVYIDNLGVDFPVYVYFSDTQLPVVAPPNTAGWFQVFTNARQGLVVAEGISDASNAQKTSVSFTDVEMVPYIDYELPQEVALFRASPNVQRTSSFANTPFAAMALGDQANQSSIALTAQNSANLFNPAVLRQPSGFYYLTAIRVDIVRAYNSPSAQQGNILIRNDDQAETIFNPVFWAPVQANVESVPGLQNVLFFTGLQMKLDATLDWHIANVIQLQGGSAQCYVIFTYQP